MKIDFHVHPYFENYDGEDVVRAMSKRNVGIAGLAGYNRDVFDFNRNILENLKFKQFKVESDYLAVRVKDSEGKGFYFPRIGEYENKEGFHLLVLGSQKRIRQKASLEENIAGALWEDSFPVIDHPFVDLGYYDISKEKEEILFDLCRKYSGKVALEWNGYCVPLLRGTLDLLVSPSAFFGNRMRFGNVNEKLENFSKMIENKGINCPVVPDTDLHARNKSDLMLIGTSCIDADIDVSSGRAIRDSVKLKVFSGDYELQKGYVPCPHFLLSYALPVTLGRISKKFYEKMLPRG